MQKAYPLSNFIAAGFAGSVRIGFALLHSLSDFLKMPPEVRETRAWEPAWVSGNWAPIAKSVFDRSLEAEKALPGTSILMVGASPTEGCGLGAKVYFTRFVAPHFRPCIMSRAIKVCSIGSGARAEEYKRCVKPLLRLTSGMLQAEVLHQGGWGRQLGFSISRALADHPRAGISRHLHVLIVRRGSIQVETNDENIYLPNNTCIQIRMPQVAQNYEQFKARAGAAGYHAARAVC